MFKVYFISGCFYRENRELLQHEATMKQPEKTEPKTERSRETVIQLDHGEKMDESLENMASKRQTEAQRDMNTAHNEVNDRQNKFATKDNGEAFNLRFNRIIGESLGHFDQDPKKQIA